MGKKQRSKRQRQEAARVAKRPPRNMGAAAPVTRPAVGERPPRLLLLVIPSIIVLLTVAVYWQSRNFGFVFLDDQLYITQNAHVLAGLTFESVKWAFTGSAAGNWHPVSWLSHMLDVQAFGLNPGAYHVENVVIHALNSVLLFALFVRMTAALWRSAFVAALFAVHPLHVESVAWISERKDVLSTLFLFLTIHAYLTYVAHASAARRVVVVVFFAIALMSKPMVVTLPFALLLLDVWPLGRIERDRIRTLSAWWPLIREKIPLFAIMLLAMALTLRAPAQTGSVISIGMLSLGARLSNSVVSYSHYVLGLFWPAGLAAYYPFHRPDLVSFIASLLLLGLGTAMALRGFRKFPWIVVGWLWFLGILVPAIGIVQVGDQGRADRFTYVPAIGIFVIVAWGAFELARRFAFTKILLSALLLVTIATSVFLSRRQVSYWKDDLSLFAHALAVTKDNYRVETLLGVALSDRNRFDEAIPHFQKSLELVPNNAETHNNYASALDAVGRSSDAAPQLAEAVRLQPSSAVFNYNLAVIRSKEGRIPEAISAITKAIDLDPTNKEYRDGLAVLQQKSR
jgi:tetratricopeptide (TPR) repeat protein